METESVQRVIQFVQQFASIVYEAMPFIVLGAVIAGFLEEFVPQRLITRLMPRNHVWAILAGALLGLPFPMCECGIIPIMRRLIRKGVPLSACTAYLLAGPIINVVVIGSTLTAFMGHESFSTASMRQMGSWGMTGMRMALGYLVAVGTSLIVERQYRIYGNKLLTPLTMPPAQPDPEKADADEVVAERKPLWLRLGNVTETALHDFVDIMVFLIIGAAISALAGQVFAHGDIESFGRGFPVLAILAMMAMAVILCLCSEADAFVAASYTQLPPAAKLAFLTLGPMLDLKLYFMYTRVFRPRLIWTIFTASAVQVFLYTVAFHYLWQEFAPALTTTKSP
ncbi:MAG TPA: permease [Gemmataceae bacterium]|nr:permease [Gemmataceae bacterium]